jgi:predicted transcriptional regulator
MEGHSVIDILQSISDIKSLTMFCSLANNSVESEVLKRTKGLSKKQFYLRTRRLLQVGLVKRSKGSFSLTNFGIVVFHAQLVIESGIKNYWKLKAVDSIQATGGIAEQERNMLIKTILNDNRIGHILVKQG